MCVCGRERGRDERMILPFDGALSFHLEFWNQPPREVPRKGQTGSAQGIHLQVQVPHCDFPGNSCSPVEVNCFHFISSVRPTLGRLQTLSFSQVPGCCPGKPELSKLLSIFSSSEFKMFNLNVKAFFLENLIHIFCPTAPHPKATDISDSEARGLVGNTTYQITRNEKYME